MLNERHTFLQEERPAFNLALMELKDRLKKARKDAGLTQVELADRAGIKQASVSEIERGLTRTSGHLVKLARICGVDPVWLSEGSGVQNSNILREEVAQYGAGSNVEPVPGPVRYYEYPEISWVQAGMPVEAIDPANIAACELHPSDAWAGEQGFWLKVNGSSMTSQGGISFIEGMVILVAPGFDVEPGNYVVAKLVDTDEATFKQYVRDSGRTFLKPLNPAFPTVEVDSKWVIVGKVVDAKWPRAVLG
jgi:SOS-response transcriptional repressor LexA